MPVNDIAGDLSLKVYSTQIDGSIPHLVTPSNPIQFHPAWAYNVSVPYWWNHISNGAYSVSPGAYTQKNIDKLRRDDPGKYYEGYAFIQIENPTEFRVQINQLRLLTRDENPTTTQLVWLPVEITGPAAGNFPAPVTTVQFKVEGIINPAFIESFRTTYTKEVEDPSWVYNPSYALVTCIQNPSGVSVPIEPPPLYANISGVYTITNPSGINCFESKLYYEIPAGAPPKITKEYQEICDTEHMIVSYSGSDTLITGINCNNVSIVPDNKYPFEIGFFLEAPVISTHFPNPNYIDADLISPTNPSGITPINERWFYFATNHVQESDIEEMQGDFDFQELEYNSLIFEHNVSHPYPYINNPVTRVKGFTAPNYAGSPSAPVTVVYFGQNPTKTEHPDIYNIHGKNIYDVNPFLPYENYHGYNNPDIFIIDTVNWNEIEFPIFLEPGEKSPVIGIVHPLKYVFFDVPEVAAVFQHSDMWQDPRDHIGPDIIPKTLVVQEGVILPPSGTIPDSPPAPSGAPLSGLQKAEFKNPIGFAEFDLGRNYEIDEIQIQCEDHNSYRVAICDTMDGKWTTLADFHSYSDTGNLVHTRTATANKDIDGRGFSGRFVKIHPSSGTNHFYVTSLRLKGTEGHTRYLKEDQYHKDVWPYNSPWDFYSDGLTDDFEQCDLHLDLSAGSYSVTASGIKLNGRCEVGMERPRIPLNYSVSSPVWNFGTNITQNTPADVPMWARSAVFTDSELIVEIQATGLDNRASIELGGTDVKWAAILLNMGDKGKRTSWFIVGDDGVIIWDYNKPSARWEYRNLEYEATGTPVEWPSGTNPLFRVKMKSDPDTILWTHIWISWPINDSPPGTPVWRYCGKMHAWLIRTDKNGNEPSYAWPFLLRLSDKNYTGASATFKNIQFKDLTFRKKYTAENDPQLNVKGVGWKGWVGPHAYSWAWDQKGRVKYNVKPPSWAPWTGWATWLCKHWFESTDKPEQIEYMTNNLWRTCPSETGGNITTLPNKLLPPLYEYEWPADSGDIYFDQPFYGPKNSAAWHLTGWPNVSASWPNVSGGPSNNTPSSDPQYSSWSWYNGYDIYNWPGDRDENTFNGQTLRKPTVQEMRWNPYNFAGISDWLTYDRRNRNIWQDTADAEHNYALYGHVQKWIANSWYYGTRLTASNYWHYEYSYRFFHVYTEGISSFLLTMDVTNWQGGHRGYGDPFWSYWNVASHQILQVSFDNGNNWVPVGTGPAKDIQIRWAGNYWTHPFSENNNGKPYRYQPRYYHNAYRSGWRPAYQWQYYSLEDTTQNDISKVIPNYNESDSEWPDPRNKWRLTAHISNVPNDWGPGVIFRIMSFHDTWYHHRGRFTSTTGAHDLKIKVVGVCLYDDIPDMKYTLMSNAQAWLVPNDRNKWMFEEAGFIV